MNSALVYRIETKNGDGLYIDDIGILDSPTKKQKAFHLIDLFHKGTCKTSCLTELLTAKAISLDSERKTGKKLIKIRKILRFYRKTMFFLCIK